MSATFTTLLIVFISAILLLELIFMVFEEMKNYKPRTFYYKILVALFLSSAIILLWGEPQFNQINKKEVTVSKGEHQEKELIAAEKVIEETKQKEITSNEEYREELRKDANDKNQELVNQALKSLKGE